MTRQVFPIALNSLFLSSTIGALLRRRQRQVTRSRGEPPKYAPVVNFGKNDQSCSNDKGSLAPSVTIGNRKTQKRTSEPQTKALRTAYSEGDNGEAKFLA